MPGFYIECYTELKWVKGEYSLPQITAEGIFIDRIRNWSENSKLFWRQRFGRRPVVCPPSNAKRLRDIQHSMSMVIHTRFHIWFIMTILLQDATEVYYKMHQVLYYKMRQKFITKCIRFFTTKCDSFITNCNSAQTKIIFLIISL